MHKSMDGDELKVGDAVGFKYSVEQYGQIASLLANGNVMIRMWDSDTGQNYHITESAKRCWKE